MEAESYWPFISQLRCMVCQTLGIYSSTLSLCWDCFL